MPKFNLLNEKKYSTKSAYKRIRPPPYKNLERVSSRAMKSGHVQFIYVRRKNFELTDRRQSTMIKAKKRIISSVLLLALVMSAFLNGFVFMGTGEVYAAEKEPPAIKDTYVVDGITYYDVKSSHIDSPIQL